MQTMIFCPNCGKELLETGFCPDPECGVCIFLAKVEPVVHNKLKVMKNKYEKKVERDFRILNKLYNLC